VPGWLLLALILALFVFSVALLAILGGTGNPDDKYGPAVFFPAKPS
jgi:hypothetical protein